MRGWCADATSLKRPNETRAIAPLLRIRRSPRRNFCSVRRMAKEPPHRPRALTPVERANLKRLLKENDEFNAFVANSPTAQEERRQREAEEERLRAERARLIKAEKAAADHLVDLQLALSDVTEDLMVVALKNSKGDLRRVARAEQWLKQINVGAIKRASPEDFTEALHVIFKSTFPEFYLVEQQSSGEQMEAALNAQRAETAKQIVNAATKARGEPPLNNIITLNIPKKET